MDGRTMADKALQPLTGKYIPLQIVITCVVSRKPIIDIPKADTMSYSEEVALSFREWTAQTFGLRDGASTPQNKVSKAEALESFTK